LVADQTDRESSVLKLTKKTDYALMALHHMGYVTDQALVNAKEIAETYHIPVEMMAKILQTLSREEVIVSVNGPKGGYALSRSPEEISVAEVITAIEGPIGIADCLLEPEAVCMQADTCTIRTPVEHIQERIVALLSGMSVAQLHGRSGRSLAITG
jgi:Rrf2 family protein